MTAPAIQAARPEDHIADAGRPYTGAEYMESLRDGREVYINGARIDDVTTHPSMRNSIRSLARLYDALHDERSHSILTCPTDTGSGGYTHRYFRVPRSREDLVAAQKAIAAWSRLTYGWMGRTPDYKAAFSNTLGANPEFYGQFADNARRWYTKAQETVPFMNHSIVNPPIDRHKPVSEVKDVYIHAEKETDAGIIVSGAKVVATSAAMTHYNFMGQTPKTATDDLSMSLAFMMPVNAPGVKMICRTSYEQTSMRGGAPFDYPLSSRFDENDAIIILDKVFIPWEDVLIYRDPQRVKAFFQGSGFLNGFLFQGCTRLAVKLDFFCSLFAKSLRTTGADEFRGVQAMLGEMIAWRHMFWSFSNAMANNPDPFTNGTVLPERQAALCYSVFAPECYPRLRELVQRALGSALIYLPSHADDFAHPEINSLLRRFARGSNDINHIERTKILKLMWDSISSEFGARHELYERMYTGAWEDVRIQVAAEAERNGRMTPMHDMVDQCLADYDEHGWVGDTWLNPEPE
jgi:4-hydroxyphenylacetate 3-monooxygenase